MSAISAIASAVLNVIPIVIATTPCPLSPRLENPTVAEKITITRAIAPAHATENHTIRLIATSSTPPTGLETRPDPYIKGGLIHTSRLLYG